MNIENIRALMNLKDSISYADNNGNLHHDFNGHIEYKYRNKTIEEVHKCEVINIVGYDSIALRILSPSVDINDDKVHTEFSSDFGSIKLNSLDKLLIIQSNSPKIGPYEVKIYYQ